MCYLYGKELLAQKEYDDAYKIFIDLQYYRDCPELAKETIYQKADMLFNNQDYEKAYYEFVSIRPYKDSEDRAKESMYQNAFALLWQRQFAQANELFILLEDYKDASSNVHKYMKETVQTLTCTDDEIIRYTCSNCDACYTETKKASGHQWSEATCTAPKTCSICGNTEGKALGHAFNESHRCSNCDYVCDCILPTFELRIIEGEECFLFIKNNDIVTLTGIRNLQFGGIGMDVLESIEPNSSLRIEVENVAEMSDYYYSWDSIVFADWSRYYSGSGKMELNVVMH